jgi:predicted Zn-dependent protease with MMP-like domain
MTWKELCRLAQETVGRTRDRLPDDIRNLAETLPVTMEAFPEGPMLADENVAPDILGLFVGPPHGQSTGEDPSLPPQILLFLENLWDEADGDLARYREEVRITYLHELGHYLGWDEGEVARRGLA